MDNYAWIWVRDQKIRSETVEGRRVLNELIDQVNQLKWGEQDAFSIHLAVEEALVNAIKHGNQEDPAKTVAVKCSLSADRCRIEIEDEGSGFDPNDVPDPTSDENLEAPSGRGLMLMKSFMTLVEFNSSGNQVVMEKHRSD